jgi:hypothetical protein
MMFLTSRASFVNQVEAFLLVRRLMLKVVNLLLKFEARRRVGYVGVAVEFFETTTKRV